MEPTDSPSYRKPFDFKEYIFRLVRQNRLAASAGFHPCLGAGLGQMQDVLRGMQNHSCFVMLDDTTDGRVEYTRASGFFTTRVFTVFILARAKFEDSHRRLQKLRSRLRRTSRRSPLHPRTDLRLSGGKTWQTLPLLL